MAVTNALKLTKNISFTIVYASKTVKFMQTDNRIDHSSFLASGA